ncbi:MAG: hypothetical protein ACYC91_00285 [Solirubrobacteraceae bacterium]
MAGALTLGRLRSAAVNVNHLNGTRISAAVASGLLLSGCGAQHSSFTQLITTDGRALVTVTVDFPRAPASAPAPCG